MKDFQFFQFFCGRTDITPAENASVHLDKPLRLGVVEGSWGWHRELPGLGKRWGEVGDPPERGVKMFELAQTNIFTPEQKKGGGTHSRFVAHCWLAGLGGG